MSKAIQIEPGTKFNRLTFIEKVKSSRGYSNGLCVCDCGKEKIVALSNLVSGKTQSCGCLQKETMRKIRSKLNEYVFQGDYVVGKTSNTGKEFYVDREDFERIKNLCWHETRNGYIANKTGKDLVLLHRFIMQPPNDLVVDHMNHNRTDNRKSNLRICSIAQNSLNRKIQPIGIQADVRGKHTYYKVNIHNKYRGCFKTYEEAKEVRDKVYEEEYKL